MVMRHWFAGRRFWLTITIAGLVAGVIGGTIALTQAGAGSPEARLVLVDESGGGTLPPDTRLLDPGSDAIEFPAWLTQLKGVPSGIAIERDGTLWVAMTAINGDFILGKGQGSQLREYILPSATPGSQPSIAIAGNGSVIVGLGNEILVIDPGTLEYRTVKLPPPPASELPGSGTVATLRVVGELAFVSRFLSDSIVAISLESGEHSSIEAPEALRGFDDFLVTETSIVLIKSGDTVGGSPSQIGIVDRSTHDAIAVKVKPRSAGVLSDGRILTVTQSPDTIAYVTSSGEVTNPPAYDLTGVFPEGMGVERPIAIAADDTAWITDLSVNSLIRFEAGSGTLQHYGLPVWVFTGPVACIPGDQCKGEPTVLTNVPATATAPNGDLYFVDQTQSRIGLIRSTRN